MASSSDSDESQMLNPIDAASVFGVSLRKNSNYRCSFSLEDVTKQDQNTFGKLADAKSNLRRVVKPPLMPKPKFIIPHDVQSECSDRMTSSSSSSDPGKSRSTFGSAFPSTLDDDSDNDIYENTSVTRVSSQLSKILPNRSAPLPPSSRKASVSTDPLSAEDELKRSKRLYYACEEFMQKERGYVAILSFLDDVCRPAVDKFSADTKLIPLKSSDELFPLLTNLRRMHSDMLESLEVWWRWWSRENRPVGVESADEAEHVPEDKVESIEKPVFGKILAERIPFMKMYSTLFSKQENAISTMQHHQQHIPQFAELINDLKQKAPMAVRGLQLHQMLPVNRLAQYLSNLTEISKFLPADSTDNRASLNDVKTMLETANASKLEFDAARQKFTALENLNRRCGGIADLVQPHRELLCEGLAYKLSARTGEVQRRYLFLLNDLLLVCSELPMGRVVGVDYKVHNILQLSGMQVVRKRSADPTFVVKSKQKAIEFLASAEDATITWETRLLRVVRQGERRRTVGNVKPSDLVELGTRAPVWVRDMHSNQCMLCDREFSTLTRRHHCRACGFVVCSKCSTHKAPLAYLEGRIERVCDSCYNRLQPQATDAASNSTDSTRPLSDAGQTPSTSHHHRLAVKASCPDFIHTGYAEIRVQQAAFAQYFVGAHPSFVIYLFVSHLDQSAQNALPIPGCTITQPDPQQIKINSANHTYLMRSFDTPELLARWLEILRAFSIAELPQTIT